MLELCIPYTFLFIAEQEGPAFRGPIVSSGASEAIACE